MKISNYLLLAFAGAALSMTSCADDPVQKNVNFGTPDTIEELEKYKGLADLKDSKKDPKIGENFKIAGNIDVDALESNINYKVLMSHNFQEFSEPAKMTYSANWSSEHSVFEYATFAKAIAQASKLGMSVYGPAVAPGTDLRVDALNQLLANKPAPAVKPDEPVYQEFTPAGATNALHIYQEKVSGFWMGQLLSAVEIEPGSYTLSGKVFTSAEKLTLRAGFCLLGQEGGEDGGFNTKSLDIAGSETYTPVEYKFTADDIKAKSSDLKLWFGDQDADFWIDDMKLVADGSDENLLPFSDFEKEGDVDFWRNQYNHTLTFEVSKPVGKREVKDEDPSTNPLAGMVKLNCGNDDCEGADLSMFMAQSPAENPGDDKNTPQVPALKAPGKSGNGISVKAQYKDQVSGRGDYTTQFWLQLPRVLKVGDKVKIKFDCKASKAESCASQAHGPNGYNYWSFAGSVNFTEDWTTFESEVITITSDHAGTAGFSRFCLNLSADEAEQVTFYFDNFEVWASEEKEEEPVDPSAGIPLTAQEKFDAIYGALNLYVSGLMQNAIGQVTTWDLISGAIADEGAGEFYPLAGAGKNVVSDGNFYWQDFLAYDVENKKFAPETYGKVVCDMAKSNFEFYGGNLADVKFFVHDFNLQNNAGSFKKAKSLVHWVNEWTKAGAQIDGVHASIDVDVNASSAELTKLAEDVAGMCQALSASNKMVKLSVNIVDGSSVVSVADIKDDQKINAAAAAMGGIVKSYISSVPSAQQYGIQISNVWNGYQRSEIFKAVSDALQGK